MGTVQTLDEARSRPVPTRAEVTLRNPRLPRCAVSRLGAFALCGLSIGVATLAGCGESAPPPSGQPTFYQDLAQTDAAVDAASAQSMISGYRSNNGLGAVVVDPD